MTIMKEQVLEDILRNLTASICAAQCGAALCIRVLKHRNEKKNAYTKKKRIYTNLSSTCNLPRLGPIRDIGYYHPKRMQEDIFRHFVY